MNIQFNDKTALVTGAGKGIGRIIAIKLVELGAKTYALSRTQADLDSLKEEVPSINTVLCDLSNWDETRTIVEQLPTFHLLVNNAGVALLDSFLELKHEDVDVVFNINIKAVINVSQIVARKMTSDHIAGAIVNVSSIASNLALSNHTLYCASKGALDMLTKVMALELGPNKIRVNSVNPTVTMTPMGKMVWGDPVKSQPMLDRIPLQRFAEVDDIASAVMFLLSDHASMLNGVLLPVDGGFSIH